MYFLCSFKIVHIDPSCFDEDEFSMVLFSCYVRSFLFGYDEFMTYFTAACAFYFPYVCESTFWYNSQFTNSYQIFKIIFFSRIWDVVHFKSHIWNRIISINLLNFRYLKLVVDTYIITHNIHKKLRRCHSFWRTWSKKLKYFFTYQDQNLMRRLIYTMNKKGPLVASYKLYFPWR